MFENSIIKNVRPENRLRTLAFPYEIIRTFQEYKLFQDSRSARYPLSLHRLWHKFALYPPTLDSVLPLRKQPEFLSPCEHLCLLQ